MRLLVERRAVVEPEEGRAERNGKQRGRSSRLHGVARRVQEGESHRRRAVSCRSLREAEEKRQEAKEQDRARERHERGQEEDEGSRAAAPRNLVGVERARRPDLPHGHREGRDGDELEAAEPEAQGARCGRRDDLDRRRDERQSADGERNLRGQGELAPRGR